MSRSAVSSRNGLLLLAAGFLLCSAADARPRPEATTPSDAEIIQRIDAAVHARTTGVAAYTVQELYSIYRNGETTPGVQVTVQTHYTRDAGKDYTPISQTGSTILRNIVVDKVLANEKEMARAANRESVALTSANYEMHPEAATVQQNVQFNGRPCIIVDLKARRKISYLFNGKGWFDATDFTLVHIEGSPAASPSFFAGQTGGVRDYAKVEGFSMAQHAEMRSHSFLFGDTLLKIDYTGYHIQLQPQSGN
jgi:hypothetical protein